MSCLPAIRSLNLVLWLAVAGSAAQAADQDAETQRLIKELSGQGPAIERSREQWEAAYGQVLRATLPVPNLPDKVLEPIILRAGVPGADVQRRAMVRVMLDWMAKTDKPDERVFLLKQLAMLGRDEAVPVLAGLLKDQSPLIREHALRALESNPSAEAGRAMAAALDEAQQAAWRVAVINAVGRRREAAAVDGLRQWATRGDAEVADAALMALGNIATPQAAQFLSAFPADAAARSRPALVRTLLLSADRLRTQGNNEAAAALYRQVRAQAREPFLAMAAVRGLVLARPDEALPLVMAALQSDDARTQAQAARLLLEMPGGTTVQTALAMLPKLPASARPLLLEALFDSAAREPGQPALRAAALQTVKDGREHLRAAAVRALAHLGTPADVPLLADLATTGDDAIRETALNSLTGLYTAGADAAIIELLGKADPKTRVTLIRSLVGRRAMPAIPALLRAADDPGPSGAVRFEARKALQALPDAGAVPALVALLERSRSPEERQIAERAIAAACRKIADPQQRIEPLLTALAGADAAKQCLLLPALGRVGGPKALEIIRTAIADADPKVQDAAVRALSNWPDARADDDLLRIARSGKTEQHRVWALRGLVRVVSVPGQKPPQEAASLLRQAMALADRTENRKLIVSRLAAVQVPDALTQALAAMDDPDLHTEATRSALRLAQIMRYSHTAEARAALEKLSRVAKDEGLRRHAANVLKYSMP